jgi:hypothetical protein
LCSAMSWMSECNRSNEQQGVQSRRSSLAQLIV